MQAFPPTIFEEYIKSRRDINKGIVKTIKCNRPWWTEFEVREATNSTSILMRRIDISINILYNKIKKSYSCDVPCLHSSIIEKLDNLIIHKIEAFCNRVNLELNSVFVDAFMPFFDELLPMKLPKILIGQVWCTQVTLVGFDYINAIMTSKFQITYIEESTIIKSDKSNFVVEDTERIIHTSRGDRYTDTQFLTMLSTESISAFLVFDPVNPESFWSKKEGYKFTKDDLCRSVSVRLVIENPPENNK